MADTSYKAPDGTTSVSIGGVETQVVDGILTVADTPGTIHTYLTKVLKFVVATEADIEGIFDSKAARTEKADLVAEMTAAGLKVDGRASLAYIKGKYDEAVASGLLKVAAPSVVTPVMMPPGASPDAPPATIGSGSTIGQA